MSIKGKRPIVEHDSLIIYHPKVGFARAWALEVPGRLGESSIFEVGVNSTNLPAISQMKINVNMWDVYHDDDSEVLDRIADAHLTLDSPR